MNEIVQNLAGFIYLIILVLIIIGLFKPNKIIPAKFNLKYRRVIILFSGLTLIILGGLIYSTLFSDLKNETKVQKVETIENDSLPIVIQKTEKPLNDSSIVLKYEPEYKILYAKLLDENSNKKDIHKKIKDIIYTQWWNEIEKFDSLKISTKYSRKIYKKCCLEYDKIYAKWLKYGDEDFDRVEFWAQSESERILKKLCVDPESLKIEKTIIQGKTSKGWKCITQYRAKNGFGGYVREFITLIIAYDDENDAYKTVAIHEN